MMAEDIVHGTTTPPTRLDAAKWVKSTMGEMKGGGKIVRNAWRKTGFEWFVDEDVDMDGEEGRV